MIRESRGVRTFAVFNSIFMIALIFITLYPLLYVLFASFSDARRLLAHEGPLALPLMPMTLEGYQLTFNNANILRSFGNTLFLVGAGTLISLALSIAAAFIATRHHFVLRNQFMGGMLLTMFFSGGIIPLFFVVKNINIYDTIWAQILPYAVSTYNIIILCTFFRGIPASLEESAMLDGANDVQVLVRIFIPLSVPVIAVISLYYGVGYWNSWYPALVFVRDRTLYPLQMILREILIANTQTSSADAVQMFEEAYNRELVKYCTVVVATVPILISYPFLQKYFVQGVMIGAVKG